ncbi:MAG: hypothetical protein O7G32_13155 [SAR324 cluster bacterium]|nr:hypothetical protein [SAR324 cluster bacterium]
MIGQETVEAAKSWCEIGARWIGSGAPKLGLNYLDRAIAVFSENKELNWLTFARHNKLDGLMRTGWEEDAEIMFDEVMEGYAQQEEAYGKALLLSHMAECQARQGRNERALGNLNLAAAIAEIHGEQTLLAHVLALQARISLEREDLVAVIRRFRRAEEILEQQGLEMEALRLRFSAAEAMVRLGERADAIALLEDLQTKLLRSHRFREALEPLRLLSQLYEESNSWDEKDRISEFVHLCGQRIVSSDDNKRTRDPAEPEIRLMEDPA